MQVASEAHVPTPLKREIVTSVYSKLHTTLCYIPLILPYLTYHLHICLLPRLLTCSPHLPTYLPTVARLIDQKKAEDQKRAVGKGIGISSQPHQRITTKDGRSGVSQRTRPRRAEEGEEDTYLDTVGINSLDSVPIFESKCSSIFSFRELQLQFAVAIAIA